MVSILRGGGEERTSDKTRDSTDCYLVTRGNSLHGRGRVEGVVVPDPSPRRGCEGGTGTGSPGSSVYEEILRSNKIKFITSNSLWFLGMIF